MLAAGTATPIGRGVVPASRILDFPKYVVAEHRKDPVRGGATGVFRYAYATALMDLRGRGWLGLRQHGRHRPGARHDHEHPLQPGVPAHLLHGRQHDAAHRRLAR